MVFFLQYTDKLQFLSILRNKLLKMLPSSRDVELCEGSRDLRPSPGHDHHDVSVASEHVNVCGELGIANLHTAKLGLRLGATNLELLDNIRDALEAMAIVVLGSACIEKQAGVTLEVTRGLKFDITYPRVELCEITRKVARSKSTTSSAAQMLLKSLSWVSRSSTFGIREYTICDHALYRVSSQIDVAKARILKLYKVDNEALRQSLR